MSAYDAGFAHVLKTAGLRDDFIAWARRTSPIMEPLARKRNDTLLALADAGRHDAALRASRFIGAESPIGRLTAADRALSQRLGLLPPPPAPKVTETRMRLDELDFPAGIIEYL